jgi:hypothetical protein
MDTDQNWYRQLLALVLLSASRAAVEFITNPGSREDAGKQLRGALADIDYDALATAATRALDSLASSSKDVLSETIDTLRDKGVDAVDEAKTRAEKQLAPEKSGGGKLKWFFILGVIGGLVYYLMDEQRRDDLLDRLTGASGPIQQTTQSVYQQAANSAQQATSQVPESVRQDAQQAADALKQQADEAQREAQS